ncbi:MAG: sigma-54 interaction domain-containing protein [Ignavibacteriales bacterium]
MSNPGTAIHKTMLDAIENILNGFDGAIMIDNKGYVTIITDKYAELAGVNKKKVLGSHILEYFPNSRMLEVVHSGKPIHADLWETNGETVFVSRMPVVWNGLIVGALGVSVFRYVNEAQSFAQRLSNMDIELQYYKNQVRKLSGAKYSFDAIVGTSPAIRGAKAKAQQVARARAPVLLVGETGTGKELFAHAIHQDSIRREKPFVRLNCAGIPENLVESELFGYEDGAFTGARKGGKPGKFELANGGTIFLDEINELPYHVQAKLLRVLQEGEIERIGSTETNLIDTRVISATNADLRQSVQARIFREDLFYRLNVFIIRVPSLRERLEDIPLLCKYFIDQCNDELGTDVTGIEPDVLQVFERYPWPGNVREMRNAIERTCLDTRRGMIRLEKLPKSILQKSNDTNAAEDLSLRSNLDHAEKELILKVLQRVRWNRNEAAEILNIHRTSLYAKMKKYGLLEDHS